MFSGKLHDNFGRFRRMRRQACHICITPIGEIYYGSGSCIDVLNVSRFDDAQSVAIKKERVVAEQFAQRRDQWVVVRYRLTFELS